jgi:cellulose synthase operon protein C
MTESGTGPEAAQIEHWLDQGLYLQVHPHVEALASRAEPASRLQAVRALRYLGADRQSECLLLRTGRRFRGDGAAVASLWRGVLSRRGAYLAGSVMARLPMPADADAASRAEAASVCMRHAAQLRDFEAMQRHRDRVRELDDTTPWLWVEWAYCCLDQDRPDLAETAAGHALVLQPGFRAALMLQASLLELAGRAEAAKHALRRALAERECAAFGQQLWPLLLEAGDTAEAAAVLDRIEVLSPRADVHLRGWLAARRADTAMRAGDLPGALEQARLVPGTGFYSRLAQRLSSPAAQPGRLVLPVPFVRQHWLTCAPATLTALSQFWARPVDHLELAEAVCYDGTPYASERQWALDSGWLVREFSADWPSTVALVQAGVPFAITTTEVASAHLQAVIGIDRLRGTLIVRDPTEPAHVEYEAESFFERYRAHGPRGLLLLPPGEAARLQGLELPDAAAWDCYFAVQAALARHDRAAARTAATALEQAHPGHWLQILAARSIALYDGNEPDILAGTERLLALHPDDGGYALSKAASLWAIGGRDAHEAWLVERAQRQGTDMLTLVRLADRLGEDERRLPAAAALLRRALRRSPALADAWTGWADIAWKLRDRSAALQRYRAASTLRDTDEAAAETYARALRMAGQGAEAVQHLRGRVQRLGALSGRPAMTLFLELEGQDRAAEGFDALAAARERRSADAELAVFAAQAWLRHGRIDAAREVLAPLARPGSGGVSQAALLRARSSLAEAEGDFAAALVLAREAVALEPLNIELRRLLVRQLDRLQGREAVIQELEQALQRFERLTGLQRLLYDWLPRGDTRELLQLDRMAALQPEDAWVLRERAVVLCNARRFDDALLSARAAVERTPGLAVSHAVLGNVLLERDGYDAARPHLEHALRLDVDHEYALRTLVAAAPDVARARSALALIADELERQPIQGESLPAFQAWAHDHLPRAELLAMLRKLHAARSHLWRTWTVLARALAAGDAEEAAQAAELMAGAAERFPLVAEVALEHAQLLRQWGRRDEARRVLQPALMLAPAWNRAVRLQVDLVDETDKHWPSAVHVLQRALALVPGDADLRGLLAWVLEQQRLFDAALQAVRDALELDAEPDWVWKTAERCATALGEPRRLLELVRAVETLRPADPWPRIVRARLAHDPADALAAAEAALALNPRQVAAWHERLRRLLELKRFDEAQHITAALPWPDGGPAELRLYGPRAQRAGGSAAAAKAGLRALLQQWPNEHALWQQLADWCDEDGEHADYAEAAEQMVRLAPLAAISQVYRGHALAKAGHHAQALEPLRRAMALAPAYRFAGLQLADSALQAGRPDEAVAALEGLWLHAAGFEVAARGARLACSRTDRAALRLWMARAWGSDRFEIEGCKALLQAVREAGLGDEIEPVQRAALAEGCCALGAALDWFEHRARRRRPAAVLDEAEAMIRAGTGAAVPLALVRWLVAQRDEGNLRSVVRTFRERYRADDALWGDVSWAWLQFGNTREVVHWLADWRERQVVPVWVLTNLCLAHACEARFDHAAEVADAALRLSPFEPDATLWRSIGLAWRGERAALHEALPHLQRLPLDEWALPLIELLRAWLALPEPGGRAAAWRCVRAVRARGGDAKPVRNFSAWLLLEAAHPYLPDVLLSLLRRWWLR